MERFQFESVNFPGHFIRHRYSLGELTPKDDPAEDFWFTLVPRGSKNRVEIVAFRSVNFPDRFLRHRESRIRLDRPEGPQDDVFEEDSRFFVEPGLDDPAGFSFRSVNLPDRYIRHRDFHLYVEPADSPNLAPDATFLRTVVPALVDQGAQKGSARG